MENWETILLPWPDWTITAYLGGGGYGKVYQIERNVSGLREEAALKIISRPADDQEIEAYYDNGYDAESMVATYTDELQRYVKEYQLMRELSAQGMAIIMISSEMDELLGMSDRIVVMSEGRKAGELSKEEFNQERILNMASGE